MRILSVDASFRRTGAVLFDSVEGQLAFYRFSSRPADTSWHALQAAVQEICHAMRPLLNTTDVYVFEEPFPHGSFSAGLYALNTALYRAVHTYHRDPINKAICIERDMVLPYKIGYGPSTLTHIHGCRKYGKSASVALAQKLLDTLIVCYDLELYSGADFFDGCAYNIAYTRRMYPLGQAKAATSEESDPDGHVKNHATNNIFTSTDTVTNAPNIQDTLPNNKREKENISLVPVPSDTREAVQASAPWPATSGELAVPARSAVTQSAKAASAHAKAPGHTAPDKQAVVAKALKPDKPASARKARISHDEAEAFIYLCKALVDHELVPRALAVKLSVLLKAPGKAVYER